MSNNVLQLRGPLGQKKNSSRPGPPSLPAGATVTSERVIALRDSLDAIADYWKASEAPHKPLVAVRYKRIVPKSGRMRRLLMDAHSKSSNDTIVGVSFWKENDCGPSRHIITHCVDIAAIDKSVGELTSLAACIDKLCDGTLTREKLEEINKIKTNFANLPLERSVFARLAVDVCNIQAFALNSPRDSISDASLVTLFNGALPSNTEFLRSIGIPETSLRTYDGSTFLLQPDEYQLLYSKAPMLIAMALHDLNDIPADEETSSTEYRETEEIPSPGDEPWIGVIDTPFNDEVYFSEWVEASTTMSEDLIRRNDRRHGTCVTSIIVDGPRLNPRIDDGCGRFRVRHIGVAVGQKFSSFSITRDIEQAVIQNPNIKVWNLSLGSSDEVSEHFISPESAALDRIQSKYGVIFVVAGTNDSKSTGARRLGAPADSINSLVVNSVRLDSGPCSYTRRGPVLSFFGKPDVSYYGGDKDQPLQTCWEAGKTRLMQGTSFAAPWIARKLAYLIHIAGFSREVAKALIIDSACGWSPSKDSSRTGYGVVPQRIEDILTTSNDEIKFVLDGTSELFDTYTYNIPVPLDKGTHPYKTKATMCYFPHCERNQGVDYTSTELALTFGRVKDEAIKPIDNNIQDVPDSIVYEEDARKLYRKWDNVKHIAEEITPRSRAQKSYGAGLWGISIKTKERLDERHGENIRFGLVVTLRALDGVNRIDEFIQRCSLRTWIVNTIDIQAQIELVNEANQEIEWE